MKAAIKNSQALPCLAAPLLSCARDLVVNADPLTFDADVGTAFDLQNSGDDTHCADPEQAAEVEEAPPKTLRVFRPVSPGATGDEICVE